MVTLLGLKRSDSHFCHSKSSSSNSMGSAESSGVGGSSTSGGMNVAVCVCARVRERVRELLHSELPSMDDMEVSFNGSLDLVRLAISPSSCK